MVQKDEENFQEYLLLCFFNQNLHRCSRANQWGSEGGATTAEAVITMGVINQGELSVEVLKNVSSQICWVMQRTVVISDILLTNN